ncbi:Synapse-associated protein of 47 kDa [Acromyrmex echinatior]|uniref:Synapse-associated protein of 47 kDa n=1 Tax=Acromyrmex echinatior TaxID=103372 RepID=F4X8J7_ACREC|nr:Synapse-associated protein of 47 kDa [Acromyrmex echinatior]
MAELKLVGTKRNLKRGRANIASIDRSVGHPFDLRKAPNGGTYILICYPGAFEMIQRALERRYAKRNDELATLAKMLNATPHFDEGARYQGRRLIAELNKEQEAFIASKQIGEKGEAVAPWVGAPNEDALREECLSLSTDRRNFVRAPPPGVEFAWDFEAVQPMAQATLALDPNLEAMRFELVPKVISEENFWRNYFYRVSLLRQGYELNAMASQQQAESNPNQTLASTDSIDHTQEIGKFQLSSGQDFPFDIAARRLAEINSAGLNDASCKMQPLEKGREIGGVALHLRLICNSD